LINLSLVEKQFLKRNYQILVDNDLIRTEQKNNVSSFNKREKPNG